MKSISSFPHSYLPACALIFLLALTYAIYLPGLKGGFLFDDYANLNSMGDYGGVVDYETFKNFVFNGFSGPLGRPVSLASFLLDDNTWPSYAPLFKATNLKIHLLTGIFILWASLHFLRLMGKDDKAAIWIALLNTAIWLLHPLLVSTTLYTVQRMAQLASSFVFAGITGYLYGRVLLNQGKTKQGYIWMSVSLVSMTALAALSKENGALLPLLVVVVEFCLPSDLFKLNRLWALIFLGLPCLGIIGLLIKEINLAENPWPTRNFNQIERLLTESRIMWEYIYHLFVPQIEGKGLFQDGFVVSKSLISPISTLFASLGLLVLFCIAIVSRRLYPFLAFSILFFLASHLLESTHLGLELYFEHRNYLGAGFLFLPLAIFLVELKNKISVKVPILCACCLLLVLSFLTWQRSILWGNTHNLERYWAVFAVDSARAQNKLGSFYLGDGNPQKALSHMEAALDRFPQSSLIAFNYLVVKIATGAAQEKDFKKVAVIMAVQPFDAQSIMGMGNLADMAIASKDPKHKSLVIEFLLSLNRTSKNAYVYQFKKVYTYTLARLYLAEQNYEEALNYFSQAIDIHNDMDAGMNMVAIMANTGRPVEASIMLQRLEVVYKRPNVFLQQSRALYDKEIVRIKNILKQDLEAIGISELIIKQPSQEK